MGQIHAVNTEADAPVWTVQKKLIFSPRAFGWTMGQKPGVGITRGGRLRKRSRHFLRLYLLHLKDTDQKKDKEGEAVVVFD